MTIIGVASDNVITVNVYSLCRLRVRLTIVQYLSPSASLLITCKRACFFELIFTIVS